jgi:hypothetical protein
MTDVNVKGKSTRRGDLMKEMWRQEKSGLMRDQHENGNHSMFTICSVNWHFQLMLMF